MVLLHPVVAGRTRAAGKLRRGSGSLRRLPPGEVRSTTIVPTRVAKKVINSELWHACAGPLVCLPQRGSLVYYFPQGHSEQVAATTKKTPNSRIPNYPSLPSQLLCQVHNITMHDPDEVYVQMTLQPVNSASTVKKCLLTVETSKHARATHVSNKMSSPKNSDGYIFF